MSEKRDKKFQIESKYNRNFSEEFKKQKVKDLVEKKITVQELSKLYEITRSTVYKWLYLYSNIEQGTKTVVQMESEYTKTKELQERLAFYERTVGQKQMEIDYLEQVLKLGSEEVGFDIKKKYAPTCLSNSGKTSKHIHSK